MISFLKESLDSIDGDERFVMTLGAGVINTLLLCFGFIDPPIYRDLTLGTVAAFIASSAYTTGVQIKQDGDDVRAP